jgi:hypothetical protein
MSDLMFRKNGNVNSKPVYGRVLDRTIEFATDSDGNPLFGNTKFELRTYWCRVLQEFRPIDEFYPKANGKDEPRAVCREAWDTVVKKDDGTYGYACGVKKYDEQVRMILREEITKEQWQIKSPSTLDFAM